MTFSAHRPSSMACRSEDIIIDPEGVYRTIKRVCQPGQHAEHLPSMLQDVLKRRPTEVDSINGEIVRRAAAHGIDVPVTRTLYCLVKMVEGTYDKRVAE
jgi:2-dehydropantoate 2-reductase